MHKKCNILDLKNFIWFFVVSDEYRLLSPIHVKSRLRILIKYILFKVNISLKFGLYTKIKTKVDQFIWKTYLKKKPQTYSIKSFTNKNIIKKWWLPTAGIPSATFSSNPDFLSTKPSRFHL